MIQLPRPCVLSMTWPLAVIEGGDRAWSAAQSVLGLALGLALAWAVGLIALTVAGQLLSLLTLRLIDRGDTDSVVPTGQRVLRGVYRALIAAAAAYFYVSLAVLSLLILAVPGAVLYALAVTPRVPGTAAVVAALLCLGAWVLIGPLIRALRVRVVDVAPGRTLRTEQAPGLWELARAVAHRVGTRPVDDIRLTAGPVVSVVERGRRCDRARNRARRTLLLGLGALDGLRIGGFRAILAHEYAHFLHRDTSGGNLVSLARATMGRLSFLALEQGGARPWNLSWQFVRGYYFLFRRLSLGASRLQEVLADRVAVRAYGVDAFEEGLRHIIRRHVEARHELDRACGRALHGIWADDDPLRSGATMELRSVAAWERFACETPMTDDDTHFHPARRLELIARLRNESADAEEDDAASDGKVCDLFADPEWLLRECRRRLETELQATLDAYAADRDGVIGACTASIHDNPGRPEPYFHRADAVFDLGDYRAAIADYSETIARDPNHGVTYLKRGVARERLGDLEGAAEDFRQAMRWDRLSSEPVARMHLGNLLARSGSYAQAIVEYSKVQDLIRTIPEVYLKRGNARVRLGQLDAAVADFTQALDLDPGSAEALVARGAAHLASGENAAARADAEAAIRLEPRLDEAHALLERAIHADPEGPKVDARRVASGSSPTLARDESRLGTLDDASTRASGPEELVRTALS